MTGLRIIQAAEVAAHFPAFPYALEGHLEMSNPIFAGW